MSEHQNIQPVTVVSASAGTGKTHTLAQEFVQGLEHSSQTKNSGRIVATTFTNKAAGELKERVRRNLIQEGKWSEAQGVLCGYLGTVNSICGRLVTEHAIESGLSPDFTVISEARLPVVFAVAVDSVVHQFADEMQESTSRLKISDWRKVVQNVIDLARNNNLGPAKLRSFAEPSWHRLEKLLPAPIPTESEEQLDTELASMLEATLSVFPAPEDDTDWSGKAKDSLQDIHRRLKAGNQLVWQDWAAIAKMKKDVGKASRSIIKPLSEAALSHSRHPRLHSDLRRTIFGVFNCAAAAMEEYDDFKRSHGLIDFVDQELLALKMLQLPEVRKSFQEKSNILLIDEFQDTSPIQLTVFLEMAKLVDYSVWVGDEKQSIFSFRGSDPELMRQASAKIVTVSNGQKRKLGKSYRSRPTLVKFTNELFSRSAKLMGVAEDRATINEFQRTEYSSENLPLHLWWLDGANADEQLASLAGGVDELLSQPEKWITADKHTKELRNIRGSDVAVLCRSNRSRIAVAKALAARGLTVATQRNNLMDTPECLLALASLRVLVDDSDTIAIAEMANLLLDMEINWLDAWVSEGKAAVIESVPCIGALASARSLLIDRTPCEVLEHAITIGGVLESVLAWGNVRQRYANLDALRGLARDYESHCGSAKSPATAAGLVHYLYKNVKDGGNQPANPDENGINVLTYHKSKGLEWPLVVLYDLNTGDRANPFGINIETADGAIDSLSPLESRSIRYWPWPYGQQQRDIQLAESAARTQESKASMLQNNCENLRLLYVGVTRARDYLLFACNTKSYGTAWLDMLRNKDDDYQKILSLPMPDETTEVELIDGVAESRAKVCRLHIPESQSKTNRQGVNDHAFGVRKIISSRETQKFLPYHLSPSTVTSEEVPLVLASPLEVIELGSRIDLTGKVDMQLLGDCVHAFLAIDNIQADMESRLVVAKSMLTRWKMLAVAASDLLNCSDRLFKYLNLTYPDAIYNTEFPITGKVGQQRVAGNIDLLLEMKDGFVIVDHKTFPGRFEDWEEHALSFAPQLALYRHQVEACSTQLVKALFIHMPVVGAMIKMDYRLGLQE